MHATHRSHFRGPFRRQLGEFGHFVDFPAQESDLSRTEAIIQRLFKREEIGAVLVEPVQVRGGINVPPPGFLPLLRNLCDEHNALLILDEIYTGFGRCGKWFACEYSSIIPDVICLGKGLTGGFPLSACVGKSSVMDAAWPPSTGEAIHTSTFLGHPVGCAMAMAQIQEITARNLVIRSARLGKLLIDWLSSEFRPQNPVYSIRGIGLLVGLELRDENKQRATAVSLLAIKQALQRGFVFLPEGEHANVISFTPPLTITENQLKSAVVALSQILSRMKS